MNATTRRRYRPLLLALIVLGHCRAYNVLPRPRKSVPRVMDSSTDSPVRQVDDERVPCHRRSFLTSIVGATLVAEMGTRPATALDVVQPGEIVARELKNRRMGGLASKIRTVGDIMVRCPMNN